MSSEFIIRDAVPADIDFIVDSWLRSHKSNGHGVRRIREDVYMAHQHPVIEKLLKRSRVRIACTTADPDVILGYVVSEPTVLHYVYVKLPLRRFAVGSRLLAEAYPGVRQFSYFCDTDGAHGLLKKMPGVHFNPFATEDK